MFDGTNLVIISYYFTGLSDKHIECATAQALSRRFPLAAARIRFQVRSYGICGGKSGTGARFL
jgi:hypothetical protein